MNNERNWIVIAGQLIDTTKGGGFEFFGPYTEDEAEAVKQRLCGSAPLETDKLTMAVELLRISDDRIDD